MKAVRMDFSGCGMPGLNPDAYSLVLDLPLKLNHRPVRDTLEWNF
jgi:hypothetical protein